MGYTKMADWYTITNKDLMAHTVHGKTLIHKYGSAPAVLTAFLKNDIYSGVSN
jgi:hypothetical protein